MSARKHIGLLRHVFQTQFELKRTFFLQEDRSI